MKGINFISTISPKKQYTIRRWFIFTVLLSIVALTGIGWLQLEQLNRFIEAKKEKNSLAHHTIAFQASSTRKEKLEEQVSTQKNKLAKITRHQTQPKNPLNVLTTITDACSKTAVQLQSLNMHKHNLELTGQCAQPEQALSLISNLNNSPLFHNLKLVSIQPTQLNQEKNRSSLLCSISGKVKK